MYPTVCPSEMMHVSVYCPIKNMYSVMPVLSYELKMAVSGLQQRYSALSLILSFIVVLFGAHVPIVCHC